MSKEISKEKTNSLLNCPFCGWEAKLMRFPKCERKFVVICENEQCMASVGNYSYSKEKAIKAWNTRKPMERIVERLEEQANQYNRRAHELVGKSTEAGIHNKGKACSYEHAIEIVKEEGEL